MSAPGVGGIMPVDGCDCSWCVASAELAADESTMRATLPPRAGSANGDLLPPPSLASDARILATAYRRIAELERELDRRANVITELADAAYGRIRV